MKQQYRLLLLFIAMAISLIALLAMQWYWLNEGKQSRQAQFDAALRELTIDGQTHRLSPKEAELLQLLASQVNKVVRRSEALQRIWKDDNYFTGRSMDVYVTKLRKYLAADPSVEIINLHGNGFRLVAPSA